MVVAERARPDVEIIDLQRTLALDLGLGVRVLRYIHSAFFGLRQQVRSIGPAVLVMLGAVLPLAVDASCPS